MGIRDIGGERRKPRYGGWGDDNDNDDDDNDEENQAGPTDGSKESKAMAEGKQRAMRSTEEGLCKSSGAGMSCVSLEAQLKEGRRTQRMERGRAPVRTWAVLMGVDIASEVFKCTS